MAWPELVERRVSGAVERAPVCVRKPAAWRVAGRPRRRRAPARGARGLCRDRCGADHESACHRTWAAPTACARAVPGDAQCLERLGLVFGCSQLHNAWIEPKRDEAYG